MEMLYVWYEIKQSWFNEVSIDIGEEGLAIYFPFYGRFMPSVLIPWNDLELVPRLYRYTE